MICSVNETDIPGSLISAEEISPTNAGKPNCESRLFEPSQGTDSYRTFQPFLTGVLFGREMFSSVKLVTRAEMAALNKSYCTINLEQARDTTNTNRCSLSV